MKFTFDKIIHKKDELKIVFSGSGIFQHKEFTKEEIDKYLGEYVTERAIDRGQTNTTVMKKGDAYKVLVKYLK